jgi:GR25 family glycosyltransferase involved in LPS biosynthesis
MFNTYVINLDSQQGRWNSQIKELNKVGIFPIRIPGILDKDITQKFKDDHFTRLYDTFGTIHGCTASHLKTYEYILNNDTNQYALILEDDAYPKFKNVVDLQHYIHRIHPLSYDMLLVHCDNNCPYKDKEQALPRSYSGAAYFVSKKGCKKLLGLKFNSTIDRYTNNVPELQKLVSKENFFWTDEDSIMSNEGSKNRVKTNQIKDNNVDKMFNKYMKINRGEKTWRHTKKYKALRVPFIQKYLSLNNILLIIIILFFFVIKYLCPKIF